jgi:hypothetical protein
MSGLVKISAMTYTAFDLHRKITEEEGLDPQSDEYYVEIDKRIRLEFPHKFGNTKAEQTSKPTQNVASATRSSKAGRKSVRLTSSQVAIAKKLGVPLEGVCKTINHEGGYKHMTNKKPTRASQVQSDSTKVETQGSYGKTKKQL